MPLTSTSSSLTRDAALPLAKPADFWLALSQGWGNLSAAAEADAALANFASVKADNVWENDKSVTMLYGPNDFFESAVVRPDQVLSELTRILHPSEITDPRPFKYFRKVAAEEVEDDTTADDKEDSTSNDSEADVPAAPAEEPNVLTGLTLGLTIGVIVLGALLVSLVVSLLFARTRTQLVGVKAVTSA